jgi:endonuclease/exonuclease/phosphatase family metal-dependent hydrolase
MREPGGVAFGRFGVKVRVGSFNVENLFGRAKVFTQSPNLATGDSLLELIDEFRELIEKGNYTDLRKTRMVELYNQKGLKDFIEIREDRGKLWKRNGWAVVDVAAGGAGEWDGGIEFKRARFNDLTRENTAKVIKATKADNLCVVEAEDRPNLKAFDTHLLNSRYKYEMLIDGNDRRGIDVGLYSKYPIGGVWTHMFDKVGNKQVFSRDCLEVEVILPDGDPLYILCNHFKSRGYDFDGTSDTKRRRQANRVAQILDKYRLTIDRVVVAGDLNDDPTSPPLKPLVQDVNNLYDVLEEQYPADVAKRWTYHYDNFEQIDYLLVSRPLRNAMTDAGVIREGIYNLDKLTSDSNGAVDVEEQHDTVTHWTNAASDHGAVWAEFDL